MPMARPLDFGSEADGAPNDDYCIHCYKGGAFTWPDATLEEFQAKMIEMSPRWGMKEEEAKTFAEDVLPNLKRWKK